QSTAQLSYISLLPEEKDPADKAVDSEEQAAAAERSSPGGGVRGRAGAGDGGTGSAGGMRMGPAAPAKVDVKIDFNRIERRARQLTRSGDTIMGVAISPDSKTYAFITTSTEGGRPVQTIWTIQSDGDRLTRLTQAARPTEEDGPPRGGRGFGGGMSAMQFARDGRTLYFRQGNGIYAASIGLGSGSGESSSPASAERPATPERTPALSSAAGRGTGGAARRINFSARVEIDHHAERKQVSDKRWRALKHRFYDADMHGVDWNRMKAVYEPLLAHAGDQEEMHEVVMQMIGELNASHTGISGSGRGERGATQTRYPGVELEPDA